MSARQAIGEPFKFSFAIKAIRAAIDRFLKHVPINKLWSIVGDYQFKKNLIRSFHLLWIVKICLWHMLLNFIFSSLLCLTDAGSSDDESK